jgi:hypothetical protein
MRPRAPAQGLGAATRREHSTSPPVRQLRGIVAVSQEDHTVRALHGASILPEQGQRQAMSLRSAQRYGLHTSDMTANTMRHIERTRNATILVKQGGSMLNTVHDAGYDDPAHRTCSLTGVIGQTPAPMKCVDAPWSCGDTTGCL